jgi:RNA polymerase sigma factor (sigma-70 family)
MTKERIDARCEQKTVAGEPQSSSCVLPPEHDRYRKRIGSKIRDQNDADDVKQNFSLRLIIALRNPGVIRDLGKYQGASARNAVRGYYRKRKTSPKEVPLDDAPEPASTACSPDEILAREEEAWLSNEKKRRLLRESLRTLSLIEAQAFLMRYHPRYRYSHSIIAQKLHVEINTVGTLLQSARRHIRAYVKKHQDDPS